MRGRGDSAIRACFRTALFPPLEQIAVSRGAIAGVILDSAESCAEFRGRGVARGLPLFHDLRGREDRNLQYRGCPACFPVVGGEGPAA